MSFAGVHIVNVPYHIDKEYTYSIPSQLEGKIKIGSVVVVPFGGANKTKNAVVTRISETCDLTLTKPILGVPGKYMNITDEMMSLCAYMKEHMFCSFGDAAKCALPSGLGVKETREYTADKEIDADSLPINLSAKNLLCEIQRNSPVSEIYLAEHFGKSAVACVKSLEKMGYVTSDKTYECIVNTKSEKCVVLNDGAGIVSDILEGKTHLTPKQMSVFETLLSYESPCPVTELCEISGAGASVVKELLNKGAIVYENIQTDRNELVLDVEKAKEEYKDFTLNDEQNKAYESLREMQSEGKASAALLYGVTGSGKTNVILKIAQSVVDAGKSVIVLVPEIALTSQNVMRFAGCFGNNVAIIHSGLSAGERMDAWKKITEDKAKVVIGTRSAVFAPVKNLGLVVIDEEQESSFKSDKSPKFHARDVARFRCAYNNAILLLASATPSVDSFYKAKSGKYKLLTLTQRFGNAKLPEVVFHDMRGESYFEIDEKTDQSKGALPQTLGTTLKDELKKTLDNKKQAILFINRRGFRSFAQCRKCGYTFVCPNCSVTLTHHINKRYKRDTMVCHYCGHTQNMPEVCPSCKKDESIVYMGAGTQLLEAQLEKNFPDTKILRMDADTTGGKMSHKKILDEFRKGKAGVLVGTQMVAKGHDFPNVSLVGVINADTSLYANDFRANEKTFSLLTQVLGRAGRSDDKGMAVIQTYNPDNDILRLSSLQDYETFYENEIRFRKSALFPPFCDIITLNFTGKIENDVVNAVKKFGEGINKLAKEDFSDVKFILYGPFQCDVYKISGNYRMRYMIKCANNKSFREMLSSLLTGYTNAVKNVSISADVNPTNL